MNPLHGLIQLALRNPYVPLMAGLLVVVLGLVTLLARIPADLLPKFETSAVQIVTFYPGMPAEVMERDIMSRLERWTGQSVGIEHQEAKAMLGVCVVKDFFQEGISMDTAMSQVTSYAMSDLFYLPPGTIPPMVMPFDPTAMTPLCLLSVSSDTHDEKELYDIAYYELRNRLQSIPGVIAPAVYGGVLKRILAYVDRDKLRSRDMDPMDVVAALGVWNTLIPTGNAKLGDTDYQLVTNGMVKNVAELDDVPIKFHDGHPVYLRDVGHVEDSHQIQSNVVRVNGRRQVYIPIYRQPGANSLAIVQGVKDTLEEIAVRLPAGVRLGVVFDQSVTIRRSIRELEVAAVIGAALAALVIVFFLRRFLPSLAVLITVPLAVLATFIGLERAGETVNVVTLGGVALAVGVMVDQAIVLMENILRHLGLGKTPLAAARDGAREVATPVFVSTVTFVAVFFPVFFLSGMAKFLFAPLALAVAFAMGASYLLAMLVIPAFAARFLRPPRAGAEGAAVRAEGGNGGPSRIGRREDAYVRFVALVVRHPRLTAAVASLLLAGALWPFSRLGQELFPRLDQGQFTVFVRARSGTRIEETERIVAGVERVITEELAPRGTGVAEAQGDAEASSAEASSLGRSEAREIISNIGVLMDWPAAYTWNSGPMDAFILVELDEDRTKSSLEHVERLREVLPRRFPGVEFAFDTAGMLTTALNSGLPSPIDVRIEGTKGYEKAHEIARYLRSEIAGIDGAADVRIQQKLDSPQISIEVDREKAAYYGITQEEVVKNIVTATNSSVNFSPSFWIDDVSGNHYFTGVQYREEAIRDLEALRNLPVRGARRETPVPLKDLARFSLSSAPAEITHLNITRMIDIFVNVDRGHDVGSVSRRVNEVIGRAKSARVDGEALIPEGFRVLQAGEFSQIERSFADFGFGFALAAVIVYSILVVLFRSLREPLIIMLAVPLGLVGVGWMLWVTGTTLNIQSFMGIVLMTGLVVEYGILLVDFANRQRAAGRSREEAIVEAARARLRPILMTSLTTALALVPMAFFGGTNAALARTILGGVIGAAVLTLFIMPALYRLLARPASSRAVGLAEEAATDANHELGLARDPGHDEPAAR